VFGNEVNGLEREDLALCHEFISIPSSDAFPSLNISHAVMIVAYELFLASIGPPPQVDQELARSEEIEDFYRHLQKTLLAIEFLDRNEPERMMFTLRQLFGRSRLNQRDVAVLRGILSAVERAARL
jgi:TrmH family RNA methyltransferase